MRTLRRLLSPSGFLFVGPAEAFLASCSDFASVNHSMSFAFRKTSAKPIESANNLFRRPINHAKALARPRTTPVSGPLVSVPTAPVPTASVLKSDLAIVRRLADGGRIREAAEACEHHLELHGPSSEGYYLLGLLKDAVGNGKGAAECYRRSLYLDPEHAEALIHLALLSETLGNSAAAERFRERARRTERNAKQGAL